MSGYLHPHYYCTYSDWTSEEHSSNEPSAPSSTQLSYPSSLVKELCFPSPPVHHYLPAAWTLSNQPSYIPYNSCHLHRHLICCPLGFETYYSPSSSLSHSSSGLSPSNLIDLTEEGNTPFNLINLTDSTFSSLSSSLVFIIFTLSLSVFACSLSLLSQTLFQPLLWRSNPLQGCTCWCSRGKLLPSYCQMTS